jgi:hypothetical protein
MKKNAILFMAILFMSFSDTTGDKAQLLLLGSYHMSNPGADVVNMTADDILSEKRQGEIEDLVKKLATFKPTKIAVEVNYGTKEDTALQANYKQYLANNYTLRKNESEQIGFRLAKILGHQKVYAIDASGDFDINKVMGFAMANGMGNKAQNIMQEMQAYIKKENELLSQSKLQAYYQHLNSQEFIEKGMELYHLFLPFTNGKLYPGADLLSDNYKRNLKIVTNLIRIKESSQDKILVIFGSGHIPFFKSILYGSPDFSIVTTGKYL